MSLFNQEKTFIIAELSANHNQNINTALETIKAAKRAGADAIKLQTYRPDTITIDSDKNDFLINQNTIWDGKTLFDLYEEAHTPWEWHEQLFEEAKKNNLYCFSSPFDFSAVDFLENLNCPAYKIASAEITDIPLIEYVANKDKPIIISTGMAIKEDIDLAVKTIKNTGNTKIAILKCTSSYPAPIEEANLVMIQELQKEYNVEVGLSDHTLGIVAPIVAVSLGAKIIEKHFILNKDIGGPDASFSLDENEFKKMVEAVRMAESAVGLVSYDLSLKQKKSREHSRSLYIVKNVKKGDIITKENVKSIRPGFGLHPKYYKSILGKKFLNDFEKGTAINLSYFE